MDERFKLYDQSDLRAAWAAFHSLCRNALTLDRPLRRPGSGAILFVGQVEFDEEQYRVIEAAARAEGDTDAYLSFLHGYEGDDGDDGGAGPSFDRHDHYRFDLRVFPPRDFDEWFPFGEHAIYSPRGAWVVLTSLERHAIAIGSPKFRSALLESPLFSASLSTFLERWKHSRDRLGARTSCVPALMDNVYGPEEADRLLTQFGEPRERWLS